MTNRKQVTGLQVAVLWDATASKTQVRVWHDELRREFDMAVRVLVDLGAEVQVLWAWTDDERERAFAEAHAVVLRGHGLTVTTSPI